MTTLTIIMPVYNETRTISQILQKISEIKIDKQLIVVDDFSSDGSREKILSFKDRIDKIIFHEKNLGKGAAIKSAKEFIIGKYVIIQDADLEYDPNDYDKLMEPLLENKFQVVYGSRVLGRNRYKASNFSSLRRVFYNHLLTILSNILNKQKLTDAHTCYKIFDTKLFKKIELKEKRFGFCPEVTTKISNLGHDIIEIPISYKGRTYKEGKKIGILDGLDAIKCLFKYKFFN